MLTLSVTNTRAEYCTGTFRLSAFCIPSLDDDHYYQYHVFNGSYIMNFECNIGTHYFNVVELL